MSNFLSLPSGQTTRFPDCSHSNPERKQMKDWPNDRVKTSKSMTTIPNLSRRRHQLPGWLVFAVKTCAAGTLLATGSLAASSGPGTADWKPVGWGGGGYYYSAAFHPTKDGVLFLGMDVGGVAKSFDHGKTFHMVNSGLADYGMYSLAVDVKNPDIAYAVTEGGLHKSTDCGETWKFVPNTGPKDLHITAERNRSIRAIAVDPTDSQIVYAASPAGKVYKSTDGTASWRVVYQKNAVAPSANSLRVQFGKVNDAYFGGIWSPLKFPSWAASTDGTGIGFTLQGDRSVPEQSYLNLTTSTGLNYRSRNIADIFANDKMHDLVFGAADFSIDPGFAKQSPDKAATAPKTPDWATVIRMDLSRVSAPDTMSAIRLSRVFFAVKGANQTVRDFTTDKQVQGYGNMRVGEPAAGGIYSVVVSAKDPSRVIAATADSGLIISEDKGETWRALATPMNAAIAAFDPVNPDVIYGAFFTEGIWKSTDRGVTWVKSSIGLDKKFSANEVVVSPGNSQEVYVIGAQGWNGDFYYSANAGATWTRSSSIKADHVADPTLPGDGPIASLSNPTNLTINPLNPKQLFISANWRPSFSDDGGRTWEERVKGADVTVHTDIRFSGNRTYVTAMDEGTFVSDDQGQSWHQLWPLRFDGDLSGHNWRLAVNNINGVDRIIATVSPWGGKSSVVVIISEDGGKTFKTTTTGLPTYQITANTMWGRGYPRALAVDPANPKVVYLGIDGDPTDGKPGGGIFKSEDGGYTWKQLPNQPACRRMYFGLAVDPTNSQRIFWGGCGTNGGVYRSEDGGNTWKRVFTQDQFLFNLHVAKDGAIYVGGSNLWGSSDHGETWKQISNFKEKRSIVGIEIDPRDPRTIWVSAVTWDGSSDGDVYKTTDAGESWAVITGSLMHRKQQILRFNPQTNELWSAPLLNKIKQ